jgi:hypothetical protein
MSTCNCGIKPLELPSTNEKYAAFVPYESNEPLRDYSNIFQFMKESERNIPESNPFYYVFLAVVIILAFMVLSYAKKYLK